MLTIVICLAWLLHAPACKGESGSFTIENDRFILDGKPIQIISGRCGQCLFAMHDNISCSQATAPR